MIRIYLVEDHLLMRKGLATSLERVEDLCVAGEAGSGEAALSALLSFPPDRLPDVVVMDIGLPGLSGLDTTRRLKEARPDLRVLMFTVHQLATEIFAAFSSG
ncbi:MAG: response regulator transcription factor, partial [Nitrospiraceae bacterium]|nr:response regulator transcription factor [Nitrospiraceae bacterium]